MKFSYLMSTCMSFILSTSVFAIDTSSLLKDRTQIEGKQYQCIEAYPVNRVKTYEEKFAELFRSAEQQLEEPQIDGGGELFHFTAGKIEGTLARIDKVVHAYWPDEIYFNAESLTEGIYKVYKAVPFIHRPDPEHPEFLRKGNGRKMVAYITDQVGFIFDSIEFDLVICRRIGDENETTIEETLDELDVFKEFLGKKILQKSEIHTVEQARSYLNKTWESLTPAVKTAAVLGALVVGKYSGGALNIAQKSMNSLKKNIAKKLVAKKVVKRGLLKAILSGAAGLFSTVALSLELKSSSEFETPYDFYFTERGAERLISFSDGNFNYALKNSPQIETYLIELARSVESL